MAMSILNQLQTRAGIPLTSSPGSGSLGGSALNSGASTPATTPAPYSATNYTPGVTAGQGGTGVNQASGLMNVQGSGIVPVGQQAAAGQGGFQTGGYQYGLGPQGNIQTSINDTSGQFNTGAINPATMPASSIQQGDPYMQRMQDAYLAQANRTLDPQWQQRSDQMASQLAAQGITPGSEAWNRQMSQFNLGRNDAYGQAMNQAILNSGAEAARMQGMDINAGNFANQAAQQNFQNQLTSQQAQNQALSEQMNAANQAGTFANTAQNQGYTQAMGQAQLNNQALQAQQQNRLGQYQADQQRKAAADAANAQISASGSQFAASMAQQETARQTAAMQAGLESRRIQDAERQQDFNNTWANRMNELTYQNGLMNVPGSPNFGNVNQMQPGQDPSGYSTLMGQGANQYATGAGSLGGAALNYYGNH